MAVVVFHVKVAELDQPRASVHVPLGSCNQNSYCGAGQPVALPVTVTMVPLAAVLAGIAEALMPVHGAVVSV